MMSQFDTSFAACGLPAILSVHGSAVTYTAAGGAPSTFSAVVGDAYEDVMVDEKGEFTVTKRPIIVPIADVPDPGVADRVTVGSDTYGVVSVGSRSAAAATLECVLLNRRVLGRSSRYEKVPR